MFFILHSIIVQHQLCKINELIIKGKTGTASHTFLYFYVLFLFLTRSKILKKIKYSNKDKITLRNPI